MIHQTSSNLPKIAQWFWATKPTFPFLSKALDPLKEPPRPRHLPVRFFSSSSPSPLRSAPGIPPWWCIGTSSPHGKTTVRWSPTMSHFGDHADRDKTWDTFFYNSKWFQDGTRPGKRLQFANLKMAIEIADLPTNNGDFPYSYVSLPERVIHLQVEQNITFRHQKRPAKRCRTRHQQKAHLIRSFFFHLDFHRNITRILSEMGSHHIYPNINGFTISLLKWDNWIT